MIPVITISREYAAGGRSIAKGLSEKLGIPWYDGDFVKKTALNSGYSEEEILAEGEELTERQHILDMILNNATDYTSSHDAIFKAQKSVMLDLCKEPCILVGRCGNVILKEAGIQAFHIFLYADTEIRIERATNLLDKKEIDAKKFVEKCDAHRKNYYKVYTGHQMDSAQDYSICLNTGVIDYDSCIEILVNQIKRFEGEMS